MKPPLHWTRKRIPAAYRQRYAVRWFAAYGRYEAWILLRYPEACPPGEFRPYEAEVYEVYDVGPPREPLCYHTGLHASRTAARTACADVIGLALNGRFS